jgi:hypothetical protein
MAERLTLKKLSDEIELLRTRMLELEQRLEARIEDRLDSALNTPASEARDTGTSGHQSGIDAEQRQRMITEEAYLIAERRGFQGGDPARDWAEAEKRIDYQLLQVSKPGQTEKRTSKPRKQTATTAKKSGTPKKAAAKVSRSAKQ